MSSIVKMRATDLLKSNHIFFHRKRKLQIFYLLTILSTLQYNIQYYLHYLLNHQEYSYICKSFDGRAMGYVLGKAEGKSFDFHGHVTALTVSPQYRRLGIANRLMNSLETVTSKIHNAYFVDLFVRPSNEKAIKMYKKLGYSIYRVVQDYYTESQLCPAENSYDMRKPMPRDADKRCLKHVKKYPNNPPIISIEELHRLGF